MATVQQKILEEENLFVQNFYSIKSMQVAIIEMPSGEWMVLLIFLFLKIKKTAFT